MLRDSYKAPNAQHSLNALKPGCTAVPTPGPGCGRCELSVHGNPQSTSALVHAQWVCIVSNLLALDSFGPGPLKVTGHVTHEHGACMPCMHDGHVPRGAIVRTFQLANNLCGRAGSAAVATAVDMRKDILAPCSLPGGKTCIVVHMSLFQPLNFTECLLAKPALGSDPYSYMIILQLAV